MSLMKCPECAGEVSDRAAACPHCGFPLQTQPAETVFPAATHIDARVREVLQNQGKIMAIKLYRELHPGMGLADAKQKVEALEALPPHPLSGPTVTSPAQPSSSPTVTSTGCLSVLLVFALAAAGWCVRLFL